MLARDTVAGVNTYNPYEAPRGGDDAVESIPADSAHDAIVESLKRTRPWVLFLSILGYLGAGLMILMGLATMAAGSVVTAPLEKGPLGGVAPFIAFFYIAIGGVYVVPSTLLFRYADAIHKYTRSGGSMKALARAVERQTSFWRFVGILTIVAMVLNVLFVFSMILLGLSKAMPTH